MASAASIQHRVRPCRARRRVLPFRKSHRQGVQDMRCHIATRLPVALVTFFVGIVAANLGARIWPGTNAAHSADERAVLEVEREYIRAHTERDVAALERVLADDFTSFGGRVKKEQRLALLANPFFVVTS